MTETLPALALSFLWGLVLGAFFFGGLWLTLVRLTAMTRPLVWLAASFLVRSAGVAAGFYGVGVDSGPRLLACLGGFVLVRAALSAHVKRSLRPVAVPRAGD